MITYETKNGNTIATIPLESDPARPLRMVTKFVDIPNESFEKFTERVEEVTKDMDKSEKSHFIKRNQKLIFDKLYDELERCFEEHHNDNNI